MSCLIPDTGESPALADSQRTLIAGRVDVLQQVTEMAAGGAARLLGHTRQLEGLVDRLSKQIESVPDPARVNLLVEQMQSVQAMMDWFTTRSAPDGNPANIAELQTDLSMSRIALVNLQDEIQQGTMLARGVREARDRLAELLGEIETLASTKARAESLLAELRVLSVSMERETETSAASLGSD
jgi:hypothetical protein